MIISISDVWATAVDDHARFLEGAITKGLTKLGTSIVEGEVAKFILDNRRLIVYGQPAELAQCILNFMSVFSGPLLRACAVEKMKKVFDYDSFSAKSTRPWTAYHLCLQAQYKVCCYCHLVATGTCLPDEKTKGYRPPIDHYYGKAEYPFLALSLFNFIPCCEKCNGPQMKGEIDFSETPHLNPLFDEESIEFSLEHARAGTGKLAEYATLNLPSEEYRLLLAPVKNHAISKMSIRTFQLKSRYADYSEQAYHLARRLRGLSTRRKFYEDELEFRVELADQLEFRPENYKGTPYGKARICLARQFGINIT